MNSDVAHALVRAVSRLFATPVVHWFSNPGPGNNLRVAAAGALLLVSTVALLLPSPQPALAQTLSGESITGKVVYSGAKPQIRNISMEANATCAKLHPNGLPSPEVILGPDNSLQNVLVYVKAGTPLAGKQFPTPSEPVKINQTGCMFEPHVVALMVNQKVEILNADPSNHNVHVMAEANPAWNVTQTPQAPPKVAQFAKPELGLVLMCNIHPWMRVYANVLSNPYYAITGADGTFTIKGLPPGTYTLEAWHERFGAQEKKVKAGAKADFTFTE